MDHGQGQKCNFLVRWLLGLLAVIACVIQCLMDMQPFCLCAWLMDGWMDGWMAGRGCGGGCSAFPAMRTKYRQHLGKHRVVWFWSLGLLVAWRATNAKQVSTAFGENVWLRCLFVAGGLPTLSFLLSFLWLVRRLVQAAWLVGCLGLEKTHTVMDGSWTGAKNVTFWRVGCLVCLP